VSGQLHDSIIPVERALGAYLLDLTIGGPYRTGVLRLWPVGRMRSAAFFAW